jgi:hypothetical protein
MMHSLTTRQAAPLCQRCWEQRASGRYPFSRFTPPGEVHPERARANEAAPDGAGGPS